MTTATETKRLETVNCSKCGGKGVLSGISYANGVCFGCHGVGTYQVDVEALKAKVGSDTRRKADWVMASTPESYSGLGYARLLKIRDFCHGGYGLQEAYPELLSHYREVGEPAFQAAQEERLEQWRATRGY